MRGDGSHPWETSPFLAEERRLRRPDPIDLATDPIIHAKIANLILNPLGYSDQELDVRRSAVTKIIQKNYHLSPDAALAIVGRHAAEVMEGLSNAD
ncbi:MAG TPA: hypothetical protein VFA15_05945 [Nitrososphaera sp.]|nr:hypothetical protein [Nitrososphaera sp.]